jgi:hypothetical protein
MNFAHPQLAPTVSTIFNFFAKSGQVLDHGENRLEMYWSMGYQSVTARNLRFIAVGKIRDGIGIC